MSEPSLAPAVAPTEVRAPVFILAAPRSYSSLIGTNAVLRQRAGLVEADGVDRT